MTNPDRDWLSPDPDTDMRPVKCAPFAGVYRMESQGEEGVPFPTLLDATVEPPLSPEAEIRGKGGCLAQAHRDSARWFVTTLGARRLECEVNGVLDMKAAG